MRHRTVDRGSLLLLSLFVLTGLAAIVNAGLTRTMTEQLAARANVQLSQEFHLAEAGLDEAWWWLNDQAAPPEGLEPFDPLTGTTCNPASNEPDLAARRRTMGLGYFLVCIDPDDANSTSVVDRFTITVTGSINGQSRLVRSIVRTESFARFAYFTHKEAPPGMTIWFLTGDRVDGPLHSNDTLHVSGAPVFDGPASSAAATLSCMHGCPPDAPSFNQGLSLGIAPIPMPTASFANLETRADSLGMTLVGNTSLSFAGSQLLVTNADRGWNNHPVGVGTESLLYVKNGNLVLAGGTLNGRLTLATNQDVIITNSIQYACNPETLQEEDPTDARPDDLACKNLSTGAIEYNDDMLGLVAKRNVQISQSAVVDPTTQTLSIQASVLAVEGSFQVQGYNSGPPRGTLHLFGGLIQKTRGLVSRFDPGTSQILHGYLKDYHYDDRFKAIAPPYYPTTGRYESTFWQDGWGE